MRPIKFRSWDKEKKLMIHDQDQDAQKHYIIKPGAWIHETVWRIGQIYGTLMQFTGLKDSAGKEIYEGDILNSGGWINQVEWCEDHSQWWCGDHVLTELRNLEIIGNIYQNPELLSK